MTVNLRTLLMTGLGLFALLAPATDLEAQRSDRDGSFGSSMS